MQENLEWIRNNKTNAFTKEEKKLLGLEGLLPYRVVDQEIQLKRVLQNIDRKPNDIER